MIRDSGLLFWATLHRPTEYIAIYCPQLRQKKVAQ